MSAAPDDDLSSAFGRCRREKPSNERAVEAKAEQKRRTLQVIDEMQAVLTARRATAE